MKLWTRLVNFIGMFLVKTFPGRAKLIEVDGKPYLHRFYIKHNGKLPGIYLHHFYQSDPDRDLHNHPWKWSFSLILTGGYYEYRYEDVEARRVGNLNEPTWMRQLDGNLVWLEPEVFDRKAPCINRLTGDTYHRVVLKDLKEGAWSIFVSGPDVKDWGFMTYDGFVPHQKYLGLSEPFQDKSPSMIAKFAKETL